MRIKLGMPMTMEEISKACGGILISVKKTTIYNLTTDTRDMTEGDLFIALGSKHSDVKKHLYEAKKCGAYTIGPGEENTDILHSDTKSALLALAEYYCKNLPIILYKIGITGSVGKTTTKEFLRVLLSRRYKCHATEENYNNEIGMPLSILSAPRDTEVLIIEMGMNHPGEIKKLSLCLKPNIALITNVGTAHIGNLGSRENIAKAKLEITEGLADGILIVPSNEPLLTVEKPTKSFGLFDKESDYNLVWDEVGSVSIFKEKNICCNSMFLPEGDHHKHCLAAAVAAALEAGLLPSLLAGGISSISSDNIRQRVFFLENYYFYADFYNASFESVMAMINLAKNRYSSIKKSLLLGDILELGSMCEKIHFSIGEAISPLIFNNLFLYGKGSEYIRLGAIKNGFPKSRIFLNASISDPQVTAKQIRENCSDKEMIFMKGSRGMRLENILSIFEGRNQ